jgi:hypothetical protein
MIRGLLEHTAITVAGKGQKINPRVFIMLRTHFSARIIQQLQTAYTKGTIRTRRILVSLASSRDLANCVITAIMAFQGLVLSSTLNVRPAFYNFALLAI